MTTTVGALALVVGVMLGTLVHASEPIELKAGDFTTTRYMAPEEEVTTREKGRLLGYGEVDYPFTIAETGWYELWVEGGSRTTDLYLDGRFVLHGRMAAEVWEPDGRLRKVLNLYLTQGDHILGLRRGWFPGLPGLVRMVLKPAGDVTGMVRVSLPKDYLCFRRTEAFPVRLAAGKQAAAYTLTMTVTDTATSNVVHRVNPTIPAGEGLLEQTLTIPTDREGVFDLAVADPAGRLADRIIQFLVVDTETPPPAPASLKRELVQTIDCATQDPDYANGATRVLKAPAGSYRESGDRGHVQHTLDAHWFAYTLNLPSVQDPYMVEFDYPDDDERTFTYSILEKELPGGRALTHGVASGGIYALSGKMHTAQLVFWPRQKDPRFHLRTWWNGQRAAASHVRVYRVTSGFPALVPEAEDGGRRFGRYQEEPVRYVQHGARPDGNQWRNLWDPAERIGQISRYMGVNHWHPTLAIYGATMWPCQFLPALDKDADAWGVLGPFSGKEPLQKDVLRLLLLVCEKYNMDLVGELFMPAGRPVARRYLEARFGGDGDIGWKDPNAKPWLVVHRTGGSPGTTSFNVLYPGIQDWVADIVNELAQRYKDSPAFGGIALRFMGWQFQGWQSFPSIHWGYGDYTVGLFEQETGTKVPVDVAAPDRFQKRYEWLLANAYEPWVSWRCKRIYAYHARLAKILTDARADLALTLSLHGPNYGHDATPADHELRGWTGLLREAGIDPALCRQTPALRIREQRHYPPGIRGVKTLDPQVRADHIDAFYDATSIQASSRPIDGGTVCTLHFDANSYESNMLRTEEVGLDPLSFRNSKEIHGAGLVFPAGRHFLERYASAMAEGNLTSITDGSHGYISWPPDILREFTAEYRRLPAVGMQRLDGADDPVALWYGPGDAQGCAFYLVNRTHYPVEATVQLPADAKVRRLATGEPAAVDADGRMAVTLESYALRAFVSATGAAPAGLQAAVPSAVREELETQVTFAEKLLSMEDAKETIVPFSLVDRQKAMARVAAARTDLQAGRTWSARRNLMHRHIVKVYAALGAYPPGLYHRKAPTPPPTARAAAALFECIPPEARQRIRVAPATEADATLAGFEILTWKDQPVRMNVDMPYANRYRLAYACISRPPFGALTLTMDDAPVPGQDSAPFSDNGTWGEARVLPPLSLARGSHRLGLFPRGRAGGLLYVDLEPLHRALTANAWMVIGPFPSPPQGRGVGAGLDAVYPPETARDLAAAYEGEAGRTVRWEKPASDSDYVDLYALTGVYSHLVSYAVTSIESPEARRVELLFGVDYWAKLWLNGTQVFTIAEGHSAPCAAQFAIPVELQKGRNELLVKVHAGSMGNGFWMAISDPGDLAVGAGA